MASHGACWSYSYVFLLVALVQTYGKGVLDSSHCADMECGDADSSGSVTLLQKHFGIAQRQMLVQRAPTEVGLFGDGNVSLSTEAVDGSAEEPNVSRMADLILLDSYSDARCLDGSPAGYFFRKAASPASNKSWVFHLQGGGFCSNKSDCIHRSHTDGGSTKDWPSTVHLTNYLVDEQDLFFSEWNAVVIGYCSGDSWTGTQTALGATVPGVQFSGHKIVEAVIDHLSDAFSLGAAESIIVSGDSIGGTGAWIHLDYIREKLPSVPTIVGAAFGGYLFPQSEGKLLYTGRGSEPPTSAMTPAAEKGYFEMWSSFVPPRCAEQMKESPWMCLFSPFVYNTLQTPVFLAHAQYDHITMRVHDGLLDTTEPWGELGNDSDVAEFSFTWRDAFFSHSKALRESNRDGVYLPACLMHTKFTTNINGIDAATAFAKWYFLRNSTTNLVDTCTELNCNPSCSYSNCVPACDWQPLASEERFISDQQTAVQVDERLFEKAARNEALNEAAGYLRSMKASQKESWEAATELLRRIATSLVE